MTRVNEKGYLERITSGRGHGASNPTWRNWWMIKYQGGEGSTTGFASLGMVSLPKRYLGKKVRFKIELMDDGVAEPQNKY